MEFSKLETQCIPFPQQNDNQMGQGYGQDVDPLALSGSDLHLHAEAIDLDQIKLEPMDSETQELIHITSNNKMSLRVRKPTKPVMKRKSQHSGSNKEKKIARKLTSKTKPKPTRKSSRRKTNIDSKIQTKNSASTSKSKNLDSIIKELLSEYCEINCTICDELILKLSQHFTSHSHQRENSPCPSEPEDCMDFQDDDDDQVNVEISDIKIEQEQDTVDTEKSSESEPEKPRRSLRERRLIDLKTKPSHNVDIDTMPAFSRKKKRKMKTRQRCPICFRRFSHQETLDEHVKTHAQQFKAPENPQSEIMGIARKYLNLKTPIEEVPKKTSGNGNVEKTMNISCPSCPAKFFKNATLEQHLKDAHDPNKILYPCNSCPALFSSTNKLGRHFKAIHPSVELGPFVCTICKRGFKQMNHLRNHVFIHHKHELDLDTGGSTSTSDMDKPFKCTFSPDCTKRYLFQRQLDNHVRTAHTRETPFMCSTCGHGSTTKLLLRRHEAKHRTDRPYVCNICNKSFNLKKYLSSHMLVHTREKPHVCDQCGVRFGQKTTLTTHYRIHTGEKNYKCKDCGEAFTFRAGLRDHVKRLHSS